MYENEFDPKIKALYTYEKVQESHAYNTTIFKYLAFREIFASLPFNFAIMYFQIPAYLWYTVTEMFYDETSICTDVAKNQNGAQVQILVGVICLLVYRACEILFYTPWSLYDTFWIDKAYGLSKATPCSFVMSRVTMFLEFAFLPLPVFVLVVKVMEWSGDNLVLAFFLSTALVEVIIIWLHPRVIRPLTESLQPLPDKYSSLKREIEKVAN